LDISLLDFRGSPNIGIYTLTTDLYTLIPIEISETKTEKIKRYLNTNIIYASIGDSTLLGVLSTANSNGIAVPYYTHDEEVDQIKKATNVNVIRINCNKTALGNLILTNDRGAVIDPELIKEKRAVKQIEDVLGVEVAQGTIVGLPYVGSLAVATNKGVLAHPMLREDERKLLEDVLKVPVDVGTVNRGVPFVASGLMANSFGVLAGFITTGPEIVMMSNSLDR